MLDGYTDLHSYKCNKKNVTILICVHDDISGSEHLRMSQKRYAVNRVIVYNKHLLTWELRKNGIFLI